MTMEGNDLTFALQSVQVRRFGAGGGACRERALTGGERRLYQCVCLRSEVFVFIPLSNPSSSELHRGALRRPCDVAGTTVPR